MPTADFDFNLKPKEAISYLQGKGFNLTFDYDEMMGAAHHQAFTVAKVTRLDLLQDVFTSLHSAIQSGETYNDWVTKLKPTLEKQGWLGTRDIINPKTGEVKTINIGSRRLKNIFNTNKRVAYNVQRHKKMSGLKQAVYWRYTSLLLPSSRDSHTQKHGTLLHRDNAFWQINYPPNGWGCKCKVRAYSEAQAKAKGMSITTDTPASIASKNWAYDVGAGSRVSQLSKLNLDQGLQHLKHNKALDSLTEAQLKQRFYQQLQIEQGGLFIDKVGDPMRVGDELFTATTSGLGKLKKRDRHLYIDELAKTIAEPDEVYLEVQALDDKRSRLVKKMFRYFRTEKGAKRAFVAIFEYQKDKTVGVTAHVLDTAKGVEARRKERLIYQKDREGAGN